MATEYWNSRLKALFEAVDGKDLSLFLTYFHDDAVLQMGNSSPVSGKAMITAKLSSFLGTVAALKHTIKCVHEASHAIVVELSVTYSKSDGSSLSLPSATLMRIREDLIHSYRAYRDISSFLNP